ncbi:hypothetical protein R1sor_017716 [Riccia sorocarpa]|uniref:Uncharacterized protein n=1 Tax=Riccia sorocarpa TaxID=122646 RepID=A0ABD3IDW0_9MARC
MRYLLSSRQLFKHVDVSLPVPSHKDEKAKWESEEIEARTQIVLNVKPSQHIHIHKCDNANAMWDKLEQKDEDDVQSILLEEELQRKKRSNSITSASALAVSSTGKQPYMRRNLKDVKKKIDKSKSTCRACGQKGHWKGDPECLTPNGGHGGASANIDVVLAAHEISTRQKPNMIASCAQSRHFIRIDSAADVHIQG